MDGFVDASGLAGIGDAVLFTIGCEVVWEWSAVFDEGTELRSIDGSADFGVGIGAACFSGSGFFSGDEDVAGDADGDWTTTITGLEGARFVATTGGS